MKDKIYVLLCSEKCILSCFIGGLYTESIVLEASVRGVDFLKVYMREKLYPFNRIFFCISRVSAVLRHA